MQMLRSTLLLIAGCLLMSGHAGAAELRGTLAKIKKTGTVTIGHRDDAVPYSYLDKNQKPAGYSIDICQEVVKKISKEVGLDVKVRYVSTNSQTRIPLIINGAVDLDCGNAFQTFARSKQIDYSYPTYFSSERLLVMKRSSISSLGDLGDKKIAVIQGTAADKFFTDQVTSKKLNASLLRVREINDGLLALSTGRVDALTSDDVMLSSMIRTSTDGKDMHIVGSPFEVSPVGLLMRQDDSQFRLVVNTSISDLAANGELFKLMDKWFGPLGVLPDAAQRSALKLIAIPD
jgi:glutamate/aspartate transport system substrate-binding protein